MNARHPANIAAVWVPVLAVAMLVSPTTARAEEPAPTAAASAHIGALTLEASPAAQFFQPSALVPAVTASVCRVAPGWLPADPARSLYDHELSDSFTFHDLPRRRAAAAPARTARRPTPDASAPAVNPPALASVPTSRKVAAPLVTPASGTAGYADALVPWPTGVASPAKLSVVPADRTPPPISAPTRNVPWTDAALPAIGVGPGFSGAVGRERENLQAYPSFAASPARIGPQPQIVVAPAAYVKIADTATTAPGRGNFSSFTSGAPVLSGGSVAFLASSYPSGTTGTATGGIFTAAVNGTALTTIASTATTAPGRGTFVNFSNPTVNGGSVAFYATSYDTGSTGTITQGIFTAAVSGTGLTTVASTATTAPGRGNFATFGTPALSGGRVAFFASSYPSGTTGTATGGIFTAAVNGTALTTIASTATTAPGRRTFFGLANNPTLNGGSVAFSASSYDMGSSGTTGQGIFTAAVDGTALTTVASNTTTAPGRGTFNSFGSGPALSGGIVAFYANSYDTGSSGTAGTGIFTAAVDGTALTTVASNTTTAPGRGTFSGFNNVVPSLSGGKVAFSASSYDTGSSGTTGGGIFTAAVNGTGLTTVASTATTAPGRGTFSSFSGSVPVLSGDSVAFSASSYDMGSSGNTNLGIFLYRNGTLLDVVTVGESLFGGTISTLSFTPSGFDGENLSFRYSLTGGVQGIGTFYTGVPEPGTWLAGALTLATAGFALCGKGDRHLFRLAFRLPRRVGRV